MYSVKVLSIGLKGLEGYRVDVEVQVKDGFESIVIVGLPDASVKESKERVTAALHTHGFPLVEKKVIINLSSAEQKKKNGPLFDLAIALGILKSGGFIHERILVETGFIGALSLDGTVHPVEGMIAAILVARSLYQLAGAPYTSPTLPPYRHPHHSTPLRISRFDYRGRHQSQTWRSVPGPPGCTFS